MILCTDAMADGRLARPFALDMKDHGGYFIVRAKGSKESAPARAFRDFMIRAVAKRPIEQFETQVTLPEAQLEPDAESYYGAPDNSVFVDPDGYPVPGGVPGPPDYANPPPPDRSRPQPQVDDDGNALPPPPPPQERLDQDWIDRVTGRDPRRDQRRPAAPPSTPQGNRQPPLAGYSSDPRPYQ